MVINHRLGTIRNSPFLPSGLNGCRQGRQGQTGQGVVLLAFTSLLTHEHNISGWTVTKKTKKYKKPLAIPKNFMYTYKCCGMIAMKREVAFGENQ